VIVGRATVLLLTRFMRAASHATRRRTGTIKPRYIPRCNREDPLSGKAWCHRSGTNARVLIRSGRRGTIGAMCPQLFCCPRRVCGKQ
jgi:hypothetical protein